MSIYRQLVNDHDLFHDFDALVDRDKVKEHEVNELKALVLKVAEAVETPMQRVQETFRQYTDHGWPHLGNLATHIRDFLPKRDDTLPINAVELAYLWLAILLHDVGMFVAEDEREQIEASDEYATHRRESRKRLELADEAESASRPVHARAIRDAVFAEFIRRRHAGRVHPFIDKHLDGDLTFRGADLAEDVGRLCESHGWGVIEPAGGRPADQCVAALDTEELLGSTTSVNFGYLACCLRLADILDFDRTRTPISAFQLVHFTEDVSRREWNKHLAVEGVRIDERSITYEARCPTADDWVAVEHFLDWVDRELVECLRLIDRFPAKLAQRYPLHLPTRVERKIRMANPRHKAGAFRFTLDYERIMQLLMDKSLYPDPALFLRELLQNALDACRYQQALADDAGLKDKYIPRIQVEDLSELPHVEEDPDNTEAWRDGPRVVFRDNGVGMSLRQVEDYFLRVGKSFYRSGEFEAEKERLAEKGIYLEACSQFGIGFLSCFLGGDRIEVVTYRYGSTPLRVLIEGAGRLFLIEELDAPTDINQFVSPDSTGKDHPPAYSGTQVTVWLRPEWRGEARGDTLSIAEILNTVAVNQEFEIAVSCPRSGKRIVSERRREQNEALRIPLQMQQSFWDAFMEVVRPSTFCLHESDSSLRGLGAIWFLDNEGDISLERGLLQVRGTGVFESDHLIAIRMSGEGQAVSSLLDPQQDLGFPISNDFRQFAADVVSYLSDQTGSDRIPASRCWGRDPNLIKALANNDFRYLRSHLKSRGEWASYGIHLGGKPRVSLFGIGLPGSFQWWNPATGFANVPEWLPKNTTVHIDVWGDLAPVPAANRLYLPYADSRRVRTRVVRVVALHAIDLYYQRRNDRRWARWVDLFVQGFDPETLAAALEPHEIIQGVDAFTATLGLAS